MSPGSVPLSGARRDMKKNKEKILLINYTSPYGRIDKIAKVNDVLCFHTQNTRAINFYLKRYGLHGVQATENWLQVLSTVTSSTNPGKQYEIRLGRDGVTYCTCKAWSMKKTCKHLVDYLTKTAKKVLKKAKAKAVTQEDPAKKIREAIRLAVATISRGAA